MTDLFKAPTRVALEEDLALNALIEDLYKAIRDGRGTYQELKDYVDGKQAAPHAPRIQRAEVAAIAKRATMNITQLAVSIPAQLSFVDGFRRGDEMFPEEWECWIKSRMAQKQTSCFTAALTYGVAYLSLENLGTDERTIKLLPTRDTTAFYRDPVNDRFPACVLTIRAYPKSDKVPGLAVYYDSERIVEFSFTQEGEFRVESDMPHPLGETPVARFVCFLDDEGSPRGIVDRLIPAQDRVNQTAFDLLSTQSFSAFKLRTASGVEGEPMYDDDGNQLYDPEGNPLMRSIPVDPSTWVQTDNPEARFGTLDETPLDGFLEALKLSVQHFSVQGQLPPHSLLGNLSNLSAETLVAAMSQTQRLAHVLKTSWGQTIVDLMELVALDMGLDSIYDEAGTYDAEPRWRDMTDHTIAAQVDALAKGVQSLGIPERATWPKFPGVTTGEIEEWERLKEEERQQMLEDPQNFDSSAQREGFSRPRARVPEGEGLIPLGGAREAA